MRAPTIILLGFLAAQVAAAPAEPQPAAPKKEAYVMVFDFACADKEYGKKLANAIRMRLARHPELEVIDRLTSEELSEPLPAGTDLKKVVAMMTGRMGVNVGLFGTADKAPGHVKLDLCLVDTRKGDKPGQIATWRKAFQDDTQRSEAIISKAVVEAVTGRDEWVPPEYGDEPEPKNFGKPLNVNGSYDAGHVGWQRPDNAATFIEKGPAGRGMILRMRTDLERWPYINYIRDIRMGKADPSRPPSIGTDTSFASLGGMEGVHFKSDWIQATPGQRYWLTAEYLVPGGKVFVKGFKKTEHAMDGLPERSLARLKLTPEQFAKLPEARRKQLVEAEAKRYPTDFLRECYRWYLNCRGEKGRWNRLAAPFPPRGGLPDYVEWLQIQVYSYWPATTYYYDNVFLYKDPNQKAPVPEEKPRTPNFGKTSDVIEKQSAEKARQAAPAKDN